MNQEQIIQMVREVCDKDKVDAWCNGFWVLTQEELERFAKLVAEHEREACAKRLDAVGCDHCATNIRARGDNK